MTPSNARLLVLADTLSQIAAELRTLAATPDQPVPPVIAADPSPLPLPIPLPAIKRRLSFGFDSANARILPIIAPVASGSTVYLVQDVFTTARGSWELGDHPEDGPYEIASWARASYLKPWGQPDTFMEAGADHNFFAAVIGLDGKLVADVPIKFWTPEYTGNDTVHSTKPGSGWANIELQGSSSFAPDRGEHGAWACEVDGQPSEVFWGAGMPLKNHYSWFVVFRAFVYGG